jgi:hypothetical protein
MFIMIIMGLLLIGLGVLDNDDVAGWGFTSGRSWFLANAMVSQSAPDHNSYR